MDTRINLHIVENRLVLTTVIECPALRVQRQFLDFILDTGSQNSFLSNKDIMKLQIPIKERSEIGEIDFGGSRYHQVQLPDFTMYLLKEDNKNTLNLQVSLTALKTTKISDKKVKRAFAMPSILGIDFLKNQKLSLHVILSENLAYLETVE